MDLDIISLLYLAYKLSPFIIISYLSLFSIINKEYKGLVLLCGVILSCFLTTLVSKTGYFETLNSIESNTDQFFQKCNLLTLTKQGPISNIPLSINIFSFLISYFVLCVSNNNLIQENWLVLLIFGLLLIADVYFIKTNNCSSYESIIAGIISGFIFGGIWFFIIDASNNPDLQFFNGKDSSEVCNKTDTNFSCRVVAT
jgi:amino acid permease